MVKRILLPLLTIFMLITSSFVSTPVAKADTVMTDGQSIVAAANWIRGQWVAGDFPDDDVDLLADGIIALSAAGQFKPTIDQMLTKLAKSGPTYTTGRPDLLAKVVLAAANAGHTDPTHFFSPSRNLEQELHGNVTNTRLDHPLAGHLTIISLQRLRFRGALNRVELQYLLDRTAPNEDGGFGSTPSESDPVITGIAMQSMEALAQEGYWHSEIRSEALQRQAEAIHWLEKTSTRRVDANGDHYWLDANGGSASATGLVVSGVGISDPSAVRVMKAAQAATESGTAWADTHMGRKGSLRATAQGILALTGKGYNQAKYIDRTPSIEATGIDDVDQHFLGYPYELAGMIFAFGAGGVNSVAIEALLSNNTWSTSQVRQSAPDGSFKIPVTYGRTTPGVTRYRVRLTFAGVTFYPYTFAVNRGSIQPLLLAAPNSAAVGTEVKARYRVTRINFNDKSTSISTQFLVNGKWSTSQIEQATPTGEIRLTYGQNRPGTYKWRLVSVNPWGVIGISGPYTLVRSRTISMTLMSAPKSVPMGKRANARVRVTGMPVGTPVFLLVEIGWQWRISRTVKTSTGNELVIPITDGENQKNAHGYHHYRWRVYTNDPATSTKVYTLTREAGP